MSPAGRAYDIWAVVASFDGTKSEAFPGAVHMHKYSDMTTALKIYSSTFDKGNMQETLCEFRSAPDL